MKMEDIVKTLGELTGKRLSLRRTVKGSDLGKDSRRYLMELHEGDSVVIASQADGPWKGDHKGKLVDAVEEMFLRELLLTFLI